MTSSGNASPTLPTGTSPVGATRTTTIGTASPAGIAVLMAESNGWQEMKLSAEDNQAEETHSDSGRIRKRLINHLLDVQLSEHLMVISGLGTSLCVVDDGGRRLAPTMGVLWAEVQKKAGDTFATVLSTVHHPATSQDIEALLSRCHLSQHLLPDQKVQDFIKSAESTIRDLCEAITGGMRTLPHHDTFLRRLSSRPTRMPRFKIFTTNYDLCFERSASEVKAVVMDGFTHAAPQEFDGACFSYDVVTRRDDHDGPDFIPNVFQLYKLHGSVDWAEKNGRIIKARGEQPVMIYPRDNKYQLSYSQPYLEMMARFQQSLRTPNTGIIISGFGFNDEHLAQPIISAVRSNSGIRLVVVDPSLKNLMSDRPGHKHIKFLEKLVLEGDKRIALMNCGFEQFASIMPEVSVVPEAESHKQRLGRVDSQ